MNICEVFLENCGYGALLKADRGLLTYYSEEIMQVTRENDFALEF